MSFLLPTPTSKEAQITASWYTFFHLYSGLNQKFTNEAPWYKLDLATFFDFFTESYDRKRFDIIRPDIPHFEKMVIETFFTIIKEMFPNEWFIRKQKLPSKF